MTRVKLFAAILAGCLSPLATTELPPPWGLVLGGLITGLSYIANHDAIAASLKKP